MGAQVNVAAALIVLGALLVPSLGQAAKPTPGSLAAAPTSLSVGKSFLDYASTVTTEEASDSVPANFPSPLVPQPRREPEPSALLLACLGLILYLGRRRQKALAAASP
jgi:hypothetical protein